jgi:hypothetical protein
MSQACLEDEIAPARSSRSAPLHAEIDAFGVLRVPAAIALGRSPVGQIAGRVPRQQRQPACIGEIWV